MVNRRELMRGFTALLDVGRFHVAGFGIYLGLCGTALLVREPTFFAYVVAGFVGLTVNYVAFAVNNLSDRDVDKLDPRRQHSPLVSRDTSPFVVWTSIVFACSLAIGFSGISYPPGALYVLLLLVMTAVVSWFQKRVNPWLMDLAYACVFPLTLLVARFMSDPGERRDIPWLLCFSLAALALQMNLCGNVKDLAFDTATRFRTIAKESGSYAAATGQVVFSRAFSVYSAALQITLYLSLALEQTSGRPASATHTIIGVVLIAVCAGVSSTSLIQLVQGRSTPRVRGNETFLWVNVIVWIAITSSAVLAIAQALFIGGLLALLLPAILRRILTLVTPRKV